MKKETERKTMNELKSNKIFKTKKVPEERRPFRNLPQKARSKIMKIWVEVVSCRNAKKWIILERWCVNPSLLL